MGTSSPIKHTLCLLSYLFGILFVWVGIYTFHLSNMDGIGQVIFGLLLSAAGYVVYDEGDKSAKIAAYLSFIWGAFVILDIGFSMAASDAPLPTNIGLIVYSVVLIGVGYLIKEGEGFCFREGTYRPTSTYTSPYQRPPQQVSTPTKRTTTTNSTFNITSSSNRFHPSSEVSKVDKRTLSKVSTQTRKISEGKTHLDADISDLLSMTGETQRTREFTSPVTDFEKNRTRSIVPGDDDVERWFKKGCDLMNFKKFDESIECFNNILQLNPGHDNALAHKGYALCALKRINEGRKCFLDTIQINPLNELALTNLLAMAQVMGDWEFFIGCCDMLLQTNFGTGRAEEIRQWREMAIKKL